MNSVESLLTTGVLNVIAIRKLIILVAGLCAMWRAASL